MFSTEDLKTAIGATVTARRNAAARLREAGNPRDPFRALPGMEQQFFEAAQSVRSYDLVLNLLVTRFLRLLGLSLYISSALKWFFPLHLLPIIHIHLSP